MTGSRSDAFVDGVSLARVNGVGAMEVVARGLEQAGIAVERVIDDAMPLFLRERDEISEENEAVRQPAAPASDGEQLRMLRRHCV